MIAQLRGSLVELEEEYAILDVGGVGYRVYLADGHREKLLCVKGDLLLHTSLVIRELSHSLYGFLERRERDLFEQLIQLSGIGPKLALSLIGTLSIESLREAVREQDYRMLTAVPGLGKKKAERLLIEMRDRLEAWLPFEPSRFALSLPSESALFRDALGALTHLGYSHNAAKRALQEVLDSLEGECRLPELIALALKRL